ncbi:hypothetical protein GLYMA_08G170350v4 [Glycine max]|nr:hypothetical protein GLYMA_08G170350v4 [Glycine max]KAH1051652.1 hypothetical protein GYH30_021514 [Glycine max]
MDGQCKSIMINGVFLLVQMVWVEHAVELSYFGLHCHISSSNWP